jgi:hypothetical protein
MIVGRGALDAAAAGNTQTVEATGSATSSAASFTVGITTLTANAVIVLGFTSNSGSLSTAPTATGAGSLTFTVGSNAVQSGVGYYYALAPTAGAYTITVTPAFAAFSTAIVISVTNSSSALFDGTVQLAGSDPISITTTNANDTAFVVYKMGGTSDPTTGSGGFTQVAASGSFMYFGYRILSATGTYTPTMSTGAGDANGALIHALKQG